MAATGRLQVDDLVVEVTVRRVRRMNVRVHPPHGDVRLSVPPRTSERAVIRFVRDSRGWIDHHRARIAAEHAAAPDLPAPRVATGVPGEVRHRFGQAWRLEVEPSSGPSCVVLRPDRRLVVRGPDPTDRRAVLAALDRWERRELRAIATGLLDHWGPRIGVAHDFLGLRRMSTRWGSCVPAGRRIWLNVALVTRPPAQLEYVVVHELVHLCEASHGPAFQRLMDLHLPDWRARRRALDAH